MKTRGFHELARRAPEPVKRRFASWALGSRVGYRVKIRYLSTKCDTFLLSYPKSGRTWLRLMLAEVMADHARVSLRNPMRFTSARVEHPLLPRILATHDDSPQIKKASQLMTTKSAYRNRDVILLVRDPRDVVVSLFFHRTRRHEESYPGDLSRFIRDPVGSLESVIAFYNIWVDQQSAPRRFHLVRYEDIHEDASRELMRILEFIGLASVDRSTLDRAVETTSFEQMQAMEATGSAGTRALRARDAADRESFKVRRGRVHGYRDYLSAADARYVDDCVENLLAPALGYRRDEFIEPSL